MRDVYVAGVGMTDIGWHERDPHEMGARVCSEALRDAGILPSQVEGLLSTPHGYMADTRKMITQRMADYLGIECGLMLDIDSGGNSTSVAMHIACDRIGEGRIDSCLVFASQREIPPKQIRGDILGHFHLIKDANSLYDSYQAAYGVISPLPFYAMAIQRYMRLHGIEAEDIARVAVLLREHALRHPQAAYKEPLTVEDVLQSKILTPPIHRHESSEMHDGAAALLLTCGDLVQDKGRAVRIAAMREAHDATSFIPYHAEISRFPCVGRAARGALEESGYAIADIDVAEVYGAFAGMEPMMYEELGFFPHGEAPAAVREGRTTHGGDVLLNPSGGRLSLGHPAYVTPLLEFIEITRQLRGDAGERQRPGASVGLVHTEQGFINGSIVAVLDRRQGRDAGAR
ncbi:MAG: thiolase family protein [Actinobacteria bacterium]|nr:thiolase family protein [Actinomycetota bacterium]